jgi:hypothetical protein
MLIFSFLTTYKFFYRHVLIIRVCQFISSGTCLNFSFIVGDGYCIYFILKLLL